MTPGAATVRIYNLTDVPSDVVKAKKLTNQHLVIGSLLLSPGENGVLAASYWETIKPNFILWVSWGAISVDRQPGHYLAMKANASGASKFQRPVKR